jgi:hypothetical protein
LNKVGPATTPEDAGKTFQQAQELAHQTAKAQSKAAYQRVDQLGRDVRVSTTSLTDFANAESNRRGSLGMDLAGGKTPQMIRKIQLAGEVPDETNIGYLKSAQASAQGERTVAAMGGRPAQVLQDALTEAGVSLPDMEQGLTFSQAHEVRAAFGRIQRAAKFSPAETARQDYGIATQFKNRIDSAMTTAAGGKETPLRQAYDEATSGYKQMADTYQRGLLAKVAKQTPDVVVNSIVKPGRVDDITKARDAVGPKGWQGVQYAQAQKLLTNSTGGIVSGDELTKRLTKLRPETLNAVYPNGEAEEFQKLGRVMQQLTKGTPSGYLEMRIEIGQGIALAGTAAGMLTGHVSPEAAAQTAGSIVLVPAMLGRILMSAQPRKALMDGLEATAGNNPGRAARAAGQLTAWLVNQGLASTTPSSGPPPSAPTPQPTAPSQGRGGGAGPMTGAPANRIPMGSPIYGPPPKH